MIKKLKTFVILTVATICSLPMMGQDLLARQAPIDRKMKAVDSMALHRLIQAESYDSPAADLYNDWNNRYAHQASVLPDTFRINLKNFCMPTTSRVITSNFGARWGRQHKGLDVKVYIGDTIRAAFSGKVRIVRYEGKGYGKYVVIRHNNGLETIYGHMSKQLVTEDQDVRAGDPIGLGGNTGRSTGSHLHFETRLCGIALNPALMFDFKNQDVVDDYYVFRKSTYNRESAEATRLRGVGGVAVSGDLDIPMARQSYASTSSSSSSSTKSVKTHTTRFHKVSKGETLSSIAKKRGMSVSAICKLNHIKSNTKIRPGQILRYN
ncbi:MAG: peptidoglycan DD-metalloendopeptidase family protein [Prevotella sp.]|nr:peptidoglycan DD-metalloendopeptidase family protein [Prevotella sp.]